MEKDFEGNRGGGGYAMRHIILSETYTLLVIGVGYTFLVIGVGFCNSPDPGPMYYQLGITFPRWLTEVRGDPADPNMTTSTANYFVLQ